jgi:UDP-GlcNAc:undecaprenyl-phosphate GlcNAc-1-phosphate transferase
VRASVGALVLALIVAAAVTPLVRTFARRAGVVDEPGGRRVHTKVIPRLGGIAVVLGFFAPLIALAFTQSDVAGMFFEDPLRALGLAGGGLLVAALGAWDDIRGVRAWHKLAVQLIAALIAWGCGFRMENLTLPFVGELDLGVFGLPITLLWIAAVVNAMNLIDGLDGLAGGIAFFACLTNFVVAALNGNPLVMLLAAALGGAILGFLLYNFNPATIFMGDSGSMFLGFILATTSMIGSSIQGSTTVAILVPLISLGVPIMDTLFAMVRRIMERRPIFSPDRGHIHHRLLDLASRTGARCSFSMACRCSSPRRPSPSRSAATGRSASRCSCSPSPCSASRGSWATSSTSRSAGASASTSTPAAPSGCAWQCPS